ncbi:bifunctional copper resistance protein CopD/cytochrome c oxidase assembly protein [Corynebacterium sp. CCM 9185]|uniref:Bifunctional copper resistance protein CopD/cytochrome c oxidase assembly protein n=1 Tax=Corynebacterium marambiense TaxID=2765364 RepID=A0ABS0VYD8_9CORY|nr:cytochrome c oxidase assembly protein [Corynebacterium marambiense]MBI9001431.1 bifunctional copper resistance protein CopD/cytochrome c oxidase assembly protein [Corynebacterium marambiense]MCK7664044.1 bifunctional copper resistance protein CopD/cytochrome c oxidase assembly protein [Corynebacterium marambiense]
MDAQPDSSPNGASDAAADTAVAPVSPGSDSSVSREHRGSGRRVRGSAGLYLLFFLTAGVVGAVISWGFLGESLAALGIPDPGPATTAGLPLLRAAAVMLISLSVGSFLFSSFLTSPVTRPLSTGEIREIRAAEDASGQRHLRRLDGVGDTTRNIVDDVPDVDEEMAAESDADRVTRDNLYAARLGVDGSIAARTGTVAAACVGMIALLLIPMYLSDVSGEPLSTALRPGNWAIAVSQVSTSLAWLAVAVIALSTAVVGFLSSRWMMQPFLLLGSICMVVPLGLEGHSATGGDHDYGTNSYLWHLLFMTLWVGGLMALIAHGRRRGTRMDLAVARYSVIALLAVAVMTVSGLINAAIRIQWSDWLTTGYGWLITAKTVGVVVLALFGYVHRKATLPAIRRDPSNHSLFRRVAAVEVLVMAAITGVAVSLGRTPPPPPRSADLNTMDIQLGYKLFEEPTLWNVWTMWRFDIVFGSLGVILAVGYAWAVYRLHQRGMDWPVIRTVWFQLGNLMLVLTMCSGIGLNMPATFSMHMIGHMILTMGVPVFWVLGGPFTLFLAALEPGGPDEPGPREWLLVAIDNPAVRFLTHPAVNTIQFVVLFYILYLTPLYDVAVTEHAGHLTMNVVFLWSGFMYYWELIGVDPVPVQRSPMGKGAWLFFSLPFHMFFGVTLMQMQTVLAYDFYSTLGLPWEIDLLKDQNVGGGIAWASGQFPLLIIFGAVLLEWWRHDRREMRIYDRRADATDDEDMTAYNEMLAKVNAGENYFDEYYERDISTSGSRKRSGDDR